MNCSALVITQTRLSDTEAIIQGIRDNFDNIDIIIYAIGRKRNDFSKKISRLNIEEVIYDYDVSKNRPGTPNTKYLNEVEQSFTEAGALNTCVSADRKIIKNGQIGLFNKDKSQFSYDETLCHMEARIRELERLFETYDFKFVFARRAEVLGGMVAYQISKRESIPFFRRNFTRIKDKYILNDNPYDYSEWFNEEYQKALAEREEYPTYSEGVQHLKEVQDGNPLYETPHLSWDDTLTRRERLTYLYNLIKSEKGGITTDYYYDTAKLEYFIQSTYKYMNKFYLNSKYESENITKPDQYVLFPLHAQPELTLMLFTKYFTEQREVAKYVAKSLPIDHQLVIKDHPRSWGQRPNSYYQTLEDQYNISVVHPQADMRELIADASAVVTITGTVGLEALVQDTPVVTFGRQDQAPFYANFSSVKVVNNIYSIPDNLKDAIDMEVDHSEIIAYISAALRVGSSKTTTMYSDLFSTIKTSYFESESFI